MIGDFRRLKFADSTGANGDESERAPSGHDFTHAQHFKHLELSIVCLLYTSDAADEQRSV